METQTLAKQNAHPRDEYITFVEEGHVYIISFEPDVKYTSVTTWNHSYFNGFDADKIIDRMMCGKSWKPGHKYWGLTADQIKSMWNTNTASLAKAGTDLHFQIECFHNQPNLPPGYSNLDLYNLYQKNPVQNPEVEWSYFIQFIKDHPQLKPYRTEWLIYHEEAKLSGSIDMVYQNPDGTFSIYDWKRSKQISKANAFNVFANSQIISHLPDANFWHYALQLNTYKYILEAKYNMKIDSLFLVRLHPNARDYELIELPDLQNDIQDLLEERIDSMKTLQKK